MAEQTYSNENAIAQIILIYSSANGGGSKETSRQTAYDTWMAGGGKPDLIESHAPNSGSQFEITVFRKDLLNPAGQPMRLRAWKGMPLFAGDRIEGGQNLSATINFLSGGRFWVAPGAVWQLNGAGDATNLHWKAAGAWKNFTTDKPVRFGTGAGTTMSIKG